MKRRSRNLLAMLLTIVMLAAECSTAFAATNGKTAEEEQKKENAILKNGNGDYTIELEENQIVYGSDPRFVVKDKAGNIYYGGYSIRFRYNNEIMYQNEAYAEGLKPGDKVDVIIECTVNEQPLVTGTQYNQIEVRGEFKDVPVVKNTGTPESVFGSYPRTLYRTKQYKEQISNKKIEYGYLGTGISAYLCLTEKGVEKFGDLSADEYELENGTDFEVKFFVRDYDKKQNVDVTENFGINFTGYKAKFMVYDEYSISFDINEIQVGRTVAQFREILEKHAVLKKNGAVQQWDSSKMTISVNNGYALESDETAADLGTEGKYLSIIANVDFHDGDKDVVVSGWGNFRVRKNAYNIFVDPFEEVASSTGASYDRTLHDLMVNAYAVKNESEKIRIGSLGEGESLFFKAYDKDDDDHGLKDSEFFKAIRPEDEYKYRLVWFIPSEQRRISHWDHLKFFAYDPQNDTANPANPYGDTHKTDGSDVEELAENAAAYVFDPEKSSTLIGAVPVDISKKFESYKNNSEYEETAKHRYTVDNKKIATVDKKGNIKPKKTGVVKISLEQKVKGSGWTKIGDPGEMFVQVPTMKKSETIAVGGKLNARTFVSTTTFAPSKWVSSKPAVAEVDPVTGEVTAKKKGTAKIIAVYGDDNKNSKKKYKTKLKVS